MNGSVGVGDYSVVGHDSIHVVGDASVRFVGHDSIVDDGSIIRDYCIGIVGNGCRT